MVISASHDHRLVALSIVVSIVAAYAAISLAERVRAGRGAVWAAWLTGAAITDGIGTCSMHYTGMLALRLTVPLQFDWRLVLLSLAVSIAGSGAALVVAGRGTVRWPRAIAGGILLGGVGIAGMHYSAMAAMRMPGMHNHYRSLPLIVLSVVFAVVVSTAALPPAFMLRGHDGPWRKHTGAVLRGIANPVMHYTAMAGVVFVSTRQPIDFSHAVGVASLSSVGIGVAPLMFLIAAALTSIADRLQKQKALLSDYPRRLIETQEAETQRIARELHDEVGQVLTGVVMMLSNLDGSVEAQARQAEATSILQDLAARVRNIALDLRPAMLDDFGLIAAIEWMIERYIRQTGVNVDLIQAGLDGVRLDPGVEITAYRIVQEALTNVARHAQTPEATVRVVRESGLLKVEVEDRGAGFDLQQLPVSRTMGLISMRERATVLGGHVTITSAIGEGTRITAELPLSGDDRLQT